MIFVPVLIFSIIEYFIGKRVISLLIFFFFLTNGFQLVPESLFEIGPISKPIDFAVLYVVIISFVNCISTRIPFRIQFDKVLKSLLAFGGFFCVILFVNIYLFHVPLVEIARTGRPFLLLLAFGVFYKLNTEEIDKLKRILFCVSIFLSLLFISQIIFKVVLLTGYVGGGKMTLGGITISRLYNQPLLNYYFLFYAIYSNPWEGKWKKISQVILIISFLLPMHRGFLLSFIIVILVGNLLISRSVSKLLRTVTILSFFVLVLSPFLIDLFTKNNVATSQEEIVEILVEGFLDFDKSVAETNTIYYRLAHLYERISIVSSNAIYSIFGIGFMTDDSPLAANFDIIVGHYSYEREEWVLFTNLDIAWSTMFIRLGFLGTLVYLFFYSNLAWFFFKHLKQEKSAIVSLLFLLLMVLTSFTSIEIIQLYPLMLPILDYYYIKKKLTNEIIDNNN